MEENLSGAAFDLLIGGVRKKIEKLKKDFEWKKLFVSTGKFIINKEDVLNSFEKELFAVFSEENLKKIAKKTNEKRGYNFPRSLHDELYDLMIRYEIPVIEAENYIHQFSQIIINYLGENDQYKTLEIFLGSWKKEEEKEFRYIYEKMDLILKRLEELNQMKINSLSIADIDAQIRRESLYKGMGLSFFELDDEEFEMKFQKEISDERIFIVGKSREETLYRILNELRKKNLDRVTLIIKSETEWKLLEKSNLAGNILIPFFYAESITAIDNNTNIFIYSEDEPCYSINKLQLRKRTKKSIVSSLEGLGINYNEAYRIVENTHGLYAALKKKLFNGAMYNKPEWIKNYSPTIIAALLCGKWTEAVGDIMIFEELAGKKYDECKKELLNFSHGESPFVVQIKGYNTVGMQLASVEDAWEELDGYINDEIWGNFIKLFYEVLIESEPIFDYPLEKHFEASIYAKKPEWSQSLKYGMIRTLIMRAYYRKHDENQRQIDNVVKSVLDTITSKERWGYISQYITDLCEASPKAVLEKLEQEFKETTGLIELFAVNDGDCITGRHYYTHILWAIEQLLQQKLYVKRAVDWLWKMNSYEIKYNISNSPKSVLDVVFCAWINGSVLSITDKIDMAREAIESYPNAWEIIYSKLPDGTSSICATLSSPKYRSVDEVDKLYVSDVSKTYIAYLHMCVDNINGNTERWKKIIESLYCYELKIQEEIMEQLINECKKMNDLEKIQIKNKLRKVIYNHRYFSDADWSMKEENIKKYECIFNEIKLENPIYEYLYLFSPIYEFPLLNPVSYEREEGRKSSRDENAFLRQKEIKHKILDFKEKGYSLNKLIELALKDDKNIVGEVLAEYYCNGNFDDTVLNILLSVDAEGGQVYSYVKYFVWKDKIVLSDVLAHVRKSTNNDNLIVNLIFLENIEDNMNAIISKEEKRIKELYWSRNVSFRISAKASEDVCLWALKECLKYGTIDSYLELLFDIKDRITSEHLYDALLAIKNLEGDICNSMTYYYFEEILKIIQNEYQNDLKKSEEIATLEWLCRNVLEWEDMKCIQYRMKTDPTMYAELVHIIYKADDENETNIEKQQLASKIYRGFEKARFCPTEKDGKVEYENIKNWIEKFKKLLSQNKQERLFGNLVGRLLPFSPIGEDGYMPCEAVRKIIEEYYSESLKNSYIVSEENKRGVYTVDAGKSENRLAQKYKDIAEGIQKQYPRTAEIYFSLSDSYKMQAEYERRRAEDEY